MVAKNRPHLTSADLAAALCADGPSVARLETAFAAFSGARYGVAFPYCTASIYVALRYLTERPGEVILPAYTCTVVPHAVVCAGHTPVFGDLAPDEYNMTPEIIRANRSADTVAVIPTHFYGYPVDVRAVRESVGSHVLVVEDRALALAGGETFGKLASDVAVYSFSQGKHLFTVNGSVLVTDRPDLYERLRRYQRAVCRPISLKLQLSRFLQLCVAAWGLGETGHSGLTWVRRLPALEGHIDRRSLGAIRIPSDADTLLTDWQAHVGLRQLAARDFIHTRRRALAAVYDAELAGCPGIVRPRLLAEASLSHYTVRVRGRNETGFVAAMARRGIEVGHTLDYLPPDLPVYQRWAGRSKYPNARLVASEVVNLPLYPSLPECRARHIAKLVRRERESTARA